MTFWESEGQNIQQSQIKKLLQENASLEQLIQEETFLDEFNTQLPELIDFLKQDHILKTLIKQAYNIEQLKNYSYKDSSKYSYIGFRVLSECNIKINETLYKNQELLDSLFSVIRQDPQKFITPQGYFQSIIRNFLNAQNPNQQEFIDILMNEHQQKVFPLVENLSKANAESIKDILSCRNESSLLLQNILFEYLLCYFLNERFTQNQFQIFDLNENFRGIFDFLIDYNLKYSFKKKYIKNLLSDFNLVNQAHKENIFYQKLCILHYVVFSEQFDYEQEFIKFIDYLNQFQNSRKFKFYLIKFTQIVQILTKSEDFQKTLNLQFFKTLLRFYESNPMSDIIHQNLLKIFLNCKTLIQQNQAYNNLICDFFLSNIMISQWQNQNKKYQRDLISANTLFQLLNIIDLNNIENEKKEQLENWKQTLSPIFNKLKWDQQVQEAVDNPKENLQVNVDLIFSTDIDLLDQKDQRLHDEDYLFKEPAQDFQEKKKVEEDLKEDKKDLSKIFDEFNFN